MSDPFNPVQQPVEASGIPPIGPGPQRKRKPRPEAPVQHLAGAVHVYVLGKLEKDNSPDEKQLDIYSGLTGYHIRTIPGSRWRNPVIVGAGAGYVAVVDRFNDCDVIRVTDPYGGAEAAGFDADGFPRGDVDWENLADIKQVPTPQGSFCTGVKISFDGIMIAGITAPDGQVSYLIADIEGTQQGYPVPSYEGLVTIEESLKDKLGQPLGHPIHYEQTAGKLMHQVFGVCSGLSSSSAVVYKLDYTSGQIEGLLGLPASSTPISIAHAGSIVSILFGTGGVGEYILRFAVLDNSFLFSGVSSPSITPKPYDYPVSRTYMVRDLLIGSNPTETDLIGYLEAAACLNEDERGTIDSGETRSLDTTTSTEANDNRTQIDDLNHTTHYSSGHDIPVSRIDLPDDFGLMSFDCHHNTLAELYNKRADDGTIDTEKIIFRLLHATHYDWLSEGGYTYGCALPTGGTKALTNGLVGISIAVDNGNDPGSLKPLPDLKAALLDSRTGRFIYRHPKPLGVKCYEGEYATLETPSATPTDCTSEAETLAEAVDGVDRATKTRSGTYPAAFDNSDELDYPWTYYIRHVQMKKPEIGMLVNESSWSRHDDEGTLLPEWDLPSPMLSKGRSQLMYLGGNAVDFSHSAGGGFFALTLPKEQSTNHAEWTKDILKLEASSASLQAEIDSGTLDEEGLALRQAQIDSNTSSVNSLREQIATTDEETVFVVPSWLEEYVFSPIGNTEHSSTQETVSPILAPAWTVQPVGTITDRNRACVIDPTVRSWLEVSYRLERTGYSIDGVSGYTNPAAKVNGLGHVVGECTRGEYSWHDPGHVYESGYNAASGALGRWEVHVLAFDENGFIIPVTKVTFPEQLDMAPSELRSPLTAAFSAGLAPELSDLVKTGSDVFFSQAYITKLRIVAELINYAYDVHRIGWRTTQPRRLYDPATGCMGTDMGWKGPNTCEAVNCGNIMCRSSIFYGYKLFANDQVIPRTRQVLWHGEVDCYPSSDPYKALGLSYGTYISGYLSFDLNGPMLGYDVDISKNG